MASLTIPSHTTEGVTYAVCLTENRCDCPDWQHRKAPGCPQAGTDCKHLRQARAERFAHLAELAGTVEDAELERLVEKYRSAPGKGLVLLALLAEAWDREQLTKGLAKDLAKPALPLPSILVRARTWGREMRDQRMRAIFA